MKEQILLDVLSMWGGRRKYTRLWQSDINPQHRLGSLTLHVAYPCSASCSRLTCPTPWDGPYVSLTSPFP